MKITEDGIVMECSGRHFEASGGYIGIDHEGSVTDGYDGSLDLDRFHVGSDGAPGPSDKVMTPAERYELASAMVERWARFGGMDFRHIAPALEALRPATEFVGWVQDSGDTAPRWVGPEHLKP